MSEDSAEWSEVDGHPFLMISRDGRVKTKDRKVKCRAGALRLVRSRIVKPGKKSNGYFHIRLGRGGKQEYVHRLVARAFIPNPEGHPLVDHINGDRSDNRAENLRWCSCAQNIQWGKGAKLTPGKVREIRQRHKSGCPQKRIAGEFGVAPNTVSQIVNYKLWSNIA